MKENLYLPKDTFEVGITSSRIENFFLRLNKFPEAYINQSLIEFKLYHHDNKKEIHCEADLTLSKWDEFLFTYIKNYYKNLVKIKSIKLDGISFKPDWRLIVGLGNSSVYETSITLHHIYGIPYIPGSAIKGIVRAYYIQKKFEETECKWKEIDIFENILETLDVENDIELFYEGKNKNFKTKFAIKNKEPSKNLYSYFYEGNKLKQNAKNLIDEFNTIFGTQLNKGSIIFFDAFPIKKPILEFDIMNVHYQGYYNGEEPPADYLNPNPIYFLTVVDTEFNFVWGILKEKHSKFHNKDINISNLIKMALAEKGIGAKTAVGYGYMKEIDLNFLKKIIDEEQRIQQKKIEKIKKEKEQKLLSSMSEFEKEIYLLEKERDKNKIDFLSSELFKKLDSFNEKEKKIAARTLKNVWQKIGKWSGKLSNKQKVKIKEVKKILEKD